MKALLLIPTFDAPNFSSIAENFAKSIGAAYIAPFDGEGDSKLRVAVTEGRLDEMLEKVVAAQSAKLTVVKGLATLPNTPYASLVNRDLANGLDADVLFVSQNAEELAVFAAAFGGLKSERVLGVIAAGVDEFGVTVWATIDGEQLTVDEEVIKNYQSSNKSQKLSPYAFRNQVVQKAQAAKNALYCQKVMSQEPLKLL